jgi:selenocysteine lyase/cysteine desulfurase
MDSQRRNFLRNTTVIASGAASMGLGNAATAVNDGTAPPRPFDPHDWTSVRAQFDLDPKLAHLANFYLASYPAPVRAAVERHRNALDRNPYSYLDDHMFGRPEDALWPKVSAAAARYLGGQLDEIALTSSTTMGLALIYNGLRLRADQEILTSTHEFYPHHESIRLATSKWGGKMRKIPLYESSAHASVDEMVGRIIAAVHANTRVLGVTWVHSGTGVVLPIGAVAKALADINRKRDDADRVLLVVDGVHGFGVLDEDVAQQGCDFFAAGTHKWILGPRGTGIIWGRAQNWPLLQPTIPSLMAGELSAAWRAEQAPKGPTKASWISPGGFFAYEHQWAVIEAFQFHESIGRKRIADRILDLNGQIRDGLSQMKHIQVWTPQRRELSAGFVCFSVDGVKPGEVVERLRADGVIASAAPYGKPCVRFSAGIVNSEDDIRRALTAVREIT